MHGLDIIIGLLKDTQQKENKKGNTIHDYIKKIYKLCFWF